MPGKVISTILIVSMLFAVVLLGLIFYYGVIEPVFTFENQNDEPVVSSEDLVAQGDITQETSIKVASGNTEELEVEYSIEDILRTTSITENDPFYLAEKYSGKTNVPVMQKEPPIYYNNDDRKKFWVLNVDTNVYREINANLVYQTSHVYFWVEEGVHVISSDVSRLCEAFENQIYPRNRSFFGGEFSPGVDNDVHLTILYANQLGGAAGYFSSADSFMPQIEIYSNKAEMFYLSAEHINLSNDYTFGVMAHEFQHMIHWFIDRNETAWVNEGLSELAVEINGFDVGYFSSLFAFAPDLQLNFWPGNEQGSSAPHYGSSYLFIKYLNQQFGDEFITNLVSQPENGFTGLDEELSQIQHLRDVDLLISEQVFQNWTIANYLDDNSIDAGIYGYGSSGLGIPFETATEISCADEVFEETVKQFGTDYLSISCDTDYEIEIEWNEIVPVLPFDAHSGKYFYWSNRGDESTMRLSRKFDFTGTAAPITLSYWVWYDIESDYDYLYVNASENDMDWKNIMTSSCTSENPTGSNFGCGYNGRSDGWVYETVDISAYAGKKITLEFEYITDAAVNGEGMVIDDFQIEEIGYFTDFEDADQDWFTDGFVRIENAIPQYFGISLINTDSDIEVEKGIFSGSKYVLNISNNESSTNEILVLSGLSRYTHIPSVYTVNVRRLN